MLQFTRDATRGERRGWDAYPPGSLFCKEGRVEWFYIQVIGGAFWIGKHGKREHDTTAG